MKRLTELAEVIAAAREYFRAAENRNDMGRLRELIEAAAVTGGDLTLNPRQTQTLHVYLASVAAVRETHLLHREAAVAAAPACVVPFPS